MKTLNKIVSAAAVAATLIGAAGTSAQAGDWHGRGYGYGGYRSGPVYVAPAPRPYYGHGGYGYHRDRRSDRIGAAVAIGVGAAILGGIIASQNRRHYPY